MVLCSQISLSVDSSKTNSWQQTHKRKSSKYRLWPSGFDETNDRILNQLNLPGSEQAFKLPYYYNETNITEIYLKQNNIKIISVFTQLRFAEKGQRQFISNKCAVNNCYLTNKASLVPGADAVVFHNRKVVPKYPKSSNQIWILRLAESPFHTNSLTHFGNLINYTATYRIDSTIVTPHEKFLPYPDSSHFRSEDSQRNYARGKTKKVAWYVQNCNSHNSRTLYAKELAKYIEVDIFGNCDGLPCPMDRAMGCFDTIRRDYKFYLAFESVNCKDYITMEFYWKALG